MFGQIGGRDWEGSEGREGGGGLGEGKLISNDTQASSQYYSCKFDIVLMFYAMLQLVFLCMVEGGKGDKEYIYIYIYTTTYLIFHWQHVQYVYIYI